MKKVALQPHPSQLRCPYCHDEVDLSQQGLLTCPACSATYHDECLRESGPKDQTAPRCCTHACTSRLETLDPRPAGVANSSREQAVPYPVVGLLLTGLATICLGSAALSVIPGNLRALVFMGGFFVICLAAVAFIFVASRPEATPRRRPTPPPKPKPRKPKPKPKPRCLLCPQEAEGGRYCAAHAALVGTPISSSPSARGVNPGPRYGPGRLDAGTSRGRGLRT